jgi:tetratricopeptide (TPR) repeat protein
MSVGSARLASYAETRNKGDLRAAYDVTQSLPMHALSLLTTYAPALESLLESLHSALRLASEDAVQLALEYAANVSHLSLILRPAENDERTGFLEARAFGLEQLSNHVAKKSSRLPPNLLMDAIVLRRRLLVLITSDDGRHKQRLSLSRLLWAYWTLEESDLDILREGISLHREILQAHRHLDSERVVACDRLASSLYALYNSTGHLTLLDEALELEREVLRIRSEGHPDRARLCENLAVSLRIRFKHNGGTVLLEEAIDLQREALRLRPEGHLDRALSCGNLAHSLRTRFAQNGDSALLEEVIELEREALHLRPKGHPGRALSCIGLAMSLSIRYNQSGDNMLLDEALELDRETLLLRPEGHPLRPDSCGNLATSLRACFRVTGDVALLDEALELEREGLRLRPEGHPDCAFSYGNLAVSLRTRFDQSGDTVLLDEVTELERKALHLRPKGHKDRALSCAGLAIALYHRFNQTGDTVLLNNALELEKEALDLRPEGHPDRVLSCDNLAVYLATCFKLTKDIALLNRALELEREALRLLPEGHPRRPNMFMNLANSLRARFNFSGDKALLDEAVALGRKAIRLQPDEHPDRANSCANLTSFLIARFNQNGDTAVLDEAQLLCAHAIQNNAVSPSDQVHLRVQLAHIHALPSSSSHSPSTAITSLLETLQYREGLIPYLYSICSILRLCVRAKLSEEDSVRLLAMYQAIIEVMPELGNVVLEKVSRLRRWRDTGDIPQEALLLALKTNNPPLGLELLEQGRAVLWSQTLAMQSPQLQGLTEIWKTQLQILLQSMSSFSEHNDIQHSNLTARNRGHASYTRLQLLLKEIRASPGLERFMRGPSYPELAQVVSVHPVIILAADDTACHAVIISSACTLPTHLILDRITESDIELLGHDMRGLDTNVRARSRHAIAEELRGISIDGRRKLGDPAVRRLHQGLKRLWVGVVKPIFERLGLGVRPRELLLHFVHCVFAEGKRQRSSTYTLVPHRRACLPPNPRCRSLFPRQSGMLLRLRRIILHADPVGAPQSTGEPCFKDPPISGFSDRRCFYHCAISEDAGPSQGAARNR